VNTLDEWTKTVATALGVDAGLVDRDLLLGLAREAAHNVARPAAPLATFLAGYAAGRDGGGAAEVRATVEKVAALAQGYTAPDGE
jgi:hypothetical protein